MITEFRKLAGEWLLGLAFSCLPDCELKVQLAIFIVKNFEDEI